MKAPRKTTELEITLAPFRVVVDDRELEGAEKWGYFIKVGLPLLVGGTVLGVFMAGVSLLVGVAAVALLLLSGLLGVLLTVYHVSKGALGHLRR